MISVKRIFFVMFLGIALILGGLFLRARILDMKDSSFSHKEYKEIIHICKNEEYSVALEEIDDKGTVFTFKFYFSSDLSNSAVNDGAEIFFNLLDYAQKNKECALNGAKITLQLQSKDDTSPTSAKFSNSYNGQIQPECIYAFVHSYNVYSLSSLSPIAETLQYIDLNEVEGISTDEFESFPSLTEANLSYCKNAETNDYFTQTEAQKLDDSFSNILFCITTSN